MNFTKNFFLLLILVNTSLLAEEVSSAKTIRKSKAPIHLDITLPVGGKFYFVIYNADLFLEYPDKKKMGIDPKTGLKYSDYKDGFAYDEDQSDEYNRNMLLYAPIVSDKKHVLNVFNSKYPGKYEALLSFYDKEDDIVFTKTVKFDLRAGEVGVVTFGESK